MRELNLPDALSNRGAGKMRVELDKKSLFALASDTRLDILRALEPTRRSVSQLAEVVGVDKAAVYRHLKKLEEGGFVKRYEDHGFIYYGLSWKARDILSPNENTKIIIMLSSSWLLVLGAIAFIALSFSTFAGERMSEADQGSGQSALDFIFTQGSGNFWVVIGVILVAIAAIIAFLALRSFKRPKQSVPAPERVAEES